MNIRDIWKYRIRPVLGCLQDFVIQVGMTLKTIPAETFSTEVEEDEDMPSLGVFLAAVAAMAMIALVLTVSVAVIIMIVKVL